jgi:hypothetical protein
MISFDLYSQERYLSSINDNQLSDKGSFGLFSSRDKYINNILSSSLMQNQSNIILNNSNGNINSKFNNSYIYQNNQTSPRKNLTISLSKKNLEYEIKISALKEKLKMLKEDNKNTQNNINLAKLRINKLQSEEKASFRELEKTQKRILNIKTNRKNTFTNKNSSKKKLNLNLSSINNTSNYKYTNKKLNFSTKKKKSIINTEYNSGNKSQILLNIKNNLNNLDKYNSYHNNLKQKKTTFNLLSPKMKYFITKNGINRSYDMIQTDDANFINNEDNQIKTSIYKKRINTNKSDLRAMMKNNLIKKLKEDELNKKKIEKELKQIEKEQYDLCANFSLNFNSRSTESNSYNTNDKRVKMYEEYENDDNIVNYNYM